MFKFTIISALAASALAFGGVDCDEACGDEWGECVALDGDCADLYTCFAAGGELEDCGPDVSTEVLEAAWGTVFSCYGDCEGDDLPDEFPYIFNPSSSEWEAITLDFVDGGVGGASTCEGSVVSSAQCETDEADDGTTEYVGYYANTEGEIMRLQCNDDCSECDWSMGMSMTVSYGAEVGVCLCPEHGDGGDDWECVIANWSL